MTIFSYCEIKSQKIWPIWKPIPVRFFKYHRIFRPSYNTCYEEININHTLLCLSQAFYIKIKTFDYFGGAPNGFCKNLTEFYQFSLKNFPNLTDFSPQLMACMFSAFLHNICCLYSLELPCCGQSNEPQQHMSHDMTKPTKWACTQRRLRSAWVSACLIRVFAVRSMGS